ncbi:hypothetical protein P700755_000823 [Psychroflexus torquis ATCC 700755]|uniref:Secretion system C-terminal sorting domain-containing protein n=1 Tax=Psychroflexus torquis (strain ATCC 700755 / CIP 106069 / ACAM 623) TaxID=313595 RepID=K4IB29_PSYTT|nr:T9SS type A sorting domain-containing protein [Psychroflexus torquis]AFU67817.1 hypothetical protein P700755_000823 [Psychroflexus torquis ATCC 700755]
MTTINEQFGNLGETIKDVSGEFLDKLIAVSGLSKTQVMMIVFGASSLGVIAQTNPAFGSGYNLVQCDIDNASGSNQDAGLISNLVAANDIMNQDQRTDELTVVGRIVDDNFDANQPIDDTNNTPILKSTSTSTATAYRNYIIAQGRSNANVHWLQTNTFFPDAGAASAGRFQGFNAAAGGAVALSNYINVSHELTSGHGALAGHNQGGSFPAEQSIDDNGTPNDPTDDLYIAAGTKKSQLKVTGEGTQSSVATGPVATSNAIDGYVYYKSRSGAQERVLATDVSSGTTDNTFDLIYDDYTATQPNRVHNQGNPEDVAESTVTVDTVNGTFSLDDISEYNESYPLLKAEDGTVLATIDDVYRLYIYDDTDTSDGAHLNPVGIDFKSRPNIEYTAYSSDPSTLSYRVMNVSQNVLNNTMVTLGTKNNQEIPEFKMYPNPATESINIEANTPLDDIEVYDMTGKRVIEVNPQGATEITVPLDRLQSGMYIMHVYDKNGGKKATKLIKE